VLLIAFETVAMLEETPIFKSPLVKLPKLNELGNVLLLLANVKTVDVFFWV